MNKDVIYIEPEDDITDIISKVKSAEQKVVALVPPKKIGVMRSAVNTKLIARTAKKYDKAVVIVTTDPSLIKLSAVAGIPVAENLQSRPKMPSDFSPEELADLNSPISIDERKFDDDNAPENPSVLADSEPKRSDQPEMKKAPKRSEIKPTELNSADIEKDDKKSKKKAAVPSLDKYRKWIIAGSVAGVALIIFLVWAIVFAPAATISVAVRTTANNFAENVSFTTKQAEENTENGVFYIEKEEYKQENSVEFSATGKKEVGDKAKGTLQVGVYVKTDYSIPAGTQFTADGLNFTADSGASISFSDNSTCENSLTSVAQNGCLLYASIAVTASEPGEKYNLASGKVWTSGLSGSVYRISNSKAFSGGTSKTAVVVQQSDIDSAKTKLEQSNESVGKDELKSKFGDEMLVIDASYEVNATDPTSSPAVGEEVQSGTTPKLTATTTYSMYAVKKASIGDYIKYITEKSLAEDQKIYSIGSPFFEKFTNDNGKFTAKLKTTTQTGPKVTEEDILEKSNGKKVGEVQSLIKSINGVSSVKVTTPFFWVNSVPNDPNKITIELKVEE